MMKITIKNINCWDEFSIDIDITNYKHILLCGMSGSGKTSVFTCIYYAITGLGMTNKWNVRNKKKAVVTLYIKSFDLEIIRTLNPKSVSIKYNDKCETGDRAQILIDNIFNTFSIIGYVKQKSTQYYFINMSPKERMLFLEKILFENLDIDMIKLKLKEKMDITKANYIKANDELNMLDKIDGSGITESDLRKMESTINTLEIELKGGYANCEQEFNSFNKLYDELQQLYKTSKEELNLLQTKQECITNYLHDEKHKYKEYKDLINSYEQSKILHASFEKSQMIIQTKIKNIYNELNIIKPQLLDLKELDEQIIMKKHLLDTHKSYLKTKEHLKQLNFEPKKYEQLINIFNNLFLYQTDCPNCKITLNIHGSHIDIGNEENNNVYENISKLKIDLHSMKIKQIKYNLLKDEMEHLNSKLVGENQLVTDEEFNELVENKRIQEELHQRYKELNNELKNIASISNITKPPKNKLSEHDYLIKKDAVDLYSEYQTKYTSNKELYKHLNTKLKNISERIEQIDDNITKLTVRISEERILKNKLQNNIDKFNNMKSIYNYNIQYNYTNECKQLYTDTCNFNKLFTKSISDIMMYTLNSINFIVKKYLSGFFDNEIYLSFGLDSEKCCINTVLIPDISTLSGGEYDRVILALVLSFAEFFKIPLLLLDEIINSLDMLTTQKVIHFIQKHYPGNQSIIYIGHQMIQGMFDNIVCMPEN